MIPIGRKPKGYRRRTRKKLRKNVRERGIPPVSRIIQDFPPGTKVTIDIDPSIDKGQPHSRYQGGTGTIAERRGRAFVVELKKGNQIKKVISRPEHLKAV